jgi:hypothetical protein
MYLNIDIQLCFMVYLMMLSVTQAGQLHKPLTQNVMYVYIYIYIYIYAAGSTPCWPNVIWAGHMLSLGVLTD